MIAYARLLTYGTSWSARAEIVRCIRRNLREA